MTYQEILDYLFSQLPIYQRDGPQAYKKDIGNIIRASKTIGNPHLKFKSIHIVQTTRVECPKMISKNEKNMKLSKIF